MDDARVWSAGIALAAAAGDDAPLRLARLCVDALGVTGAGISMMTSAGVRSVVCATDAVAERIELLQFTLGVGPCVDATHQRSPVVINDLDRCDDILIERWPGFFDGIAALNVGALFAFPLCIGAIDLGALDLYRTEPGELTASELAGALTAADAATVALLDRQTRRLEPFAEDPGARSTYFAPVHQATGMAQVQLGVSTDEAFLLIRARAFATDRTVTDVAQDIVERRFRFSQEDS